MGIRISLAILVVVLMTSTCLCQSALNVSQLHDDLLTLNPNVRPASNMSEPTLVNITFHLMSIISLDTASQKLISNGWMSVTWQNDYATWNPQDYGGIEYVTPRVNETWRPRVTVVNTLKELKPVGEDYVVLSLLSNGVVVWFPAERFETFCEIDVTFFPFDFQRCRWEMFGWAEDVNVVLLQSTVPHIDLDSYRESGEWELVSTRAWESITVAGYLEYSTVYFEVTLRRRPTLLVLTVLVPVMVVSVTNVYVFTIPSEAGERLAYSMTSLLSFGVFMSFIVDLMPSSSETVSIMAAHLSCQLIFSALYVLLCILSLRLFHRDTSKHPVPTTLQTTIVYLETLLCLDPPSHSTTTTNPVSLSGVDVISSRSSDNSFFGTEVKGSSRLKGQLEKWARKRKAKEEAYSQPQDMTWQRVSRTLDKLLFRFFFCLVSASSVVVFLVMAINYTNAV